ncbi:MAG: TrmH family RNA methyltransferase [Myxococcota bacterium]|nr:TrmH family RNA methyltransferase [Myxococcota bacterium]
MGPSSSSALAEEIPCEALLDEALFDPDPVVRDRANQALAERVESDWLLKTIDALDAARDLTRRRALRLLSNLPPKHSHKHLKAVLTNPDAAVRIRVAAARVLTATSDGEIQEFKTALTADQVKIRRASATVSAPKAALMSALFDTDTEVVNRAAHALLKREIKLPRALLTRFESVSIQPSENLVRLIAFSDSESHLLHGFAQLGINAAYDYSTSVDTLADRPILKAWALAEQGRFDQLQGGPKEPYVRACLARHLPIDHPQLQRLIHDADTAVSWFAEQNLAGRYADDQMAKRLEPDPIQLSPSSQAPYGLRASDRIGPTQRVDACLALNQPRFNMNLGVAMRSAEAAGINRVVFVGRGDFMRSPARGADLALDVTTCSDAAALVTFARENNYQIVAIQQTASSVDYHRATYPPKPLFVVGSEDAGMPKALREAADLVVQIPQFGLIDSLNVATAATVVLFHWRVHLTNS